MPDSLHSLSKLVYLNQFSRETFIAVLEEDIFNLLNSRSLYNSSFDQYGELLTHYGLADCSSYNPYSTADQEKVAIIITDCLTKFEPRLKDLCVIPINVTGEKIDINFHFKITAVMLFAQEEVPLIMESKFRVNSNKIYISIRDQNGK